MTAVSLVVELDSMKLRSGGPAMANIWLNINGRDFPAHGWNDFVVVVLGWWVTALLHLIRNENTPVTVNFMEGPYAVEISKVSSKRLRFRALEGVFRNKEAAIGEESAMLFILALVAQSREVVDGCKKQNWMSSDVEILKSALEALELESSRLIP